MNNKIYLETEAILPLIKETLKSGKKISVTVTGNSMMPLFSHRRDSVVLEKAFVYKPKDIVLYLREGEKPVLHRIIGKKEGRYSMCGDNQEVAEYPILEEQILGRVCEFERKGRKVQTDNIVYRIYSFIWCLSLKHRKYLMYLPLKIVSRKGKRK